MSLTGKQVGELQALYKSVYSSKEIKEDIILTNEELEELCEHILGEAFDAIVLDEVIKKITKTAVSNPGLRSNALKLMKDAASKLFQPKTTAGGVTRIGGAITAGAIEGKTDGKVTKTTAAALNPKNVYGYLKGMSTAVDKNMQGAGQILKDKDKGKYYTTDQARNLKNSFEFDNFKLHIVEDAKSLEDLTKELNKKPNKVKVTPFKDTSMGKPKPNDNIKNKEEKSKLSNIPPAEGSDKKFNPDFGKKSEINKVDTNKVDTNQNNVVKKGPDLDAIGKYSRNREVTMKDFQPSKPVIKPEVKTPEPEVKKMNPIEVKNRARFGDDRVKMLKTKNIDFKAMRKGDMTKDDFIKKYPKSITAQKAAGLRDEYEPYDLVLGYVLTEGHADTVEEAHYVMTQMDAETIQTIIEKTGVFQDPKLNIKYPDQPKMTEKGKQILPNLPDPTIVRGNKVIYKPKGTPRIFGDPTGKMSDFFRS